MKTNWLPIVIFCFPAWLLFGVPAYSQDAPSFEQGMNPKAIYQSGDFDHVNMANGRLNLHIPLVTDQSQRGNLNYTYSLSYSSPSWIIAVNSRGQGYWKPATDSAVTFGEDVSLFVRERSVNDGGTSYHMFLAVEGSGNVHPLGSLSSGGLGAIDGSGITDTSALIDKQGRQLVTPTTGYPYLQDANGNEMTSSSLFEMTASPSFMTDTLGRPWTSSGVLSDVIGCPDLLPEN